VHPALAETGVRLALKYMAMWGWGKVAQGLVDNYPNPPVDPVVTLSANWINQSLGTDISVQEIAEILGRLGFKCEIDGDRITTYTPPHRLDINEGLIGRADLLEEISRIYGYDKIPSRRLDQPLPSQIVDAGLIMQETLRDLLVNLGLQELVAYRMTSPEREARRLPVDYSAPNEEYIEIQNPITVERRVMRRSILATMLEALEYNCHLDPRLAFFEIGPVFLPVSRQELPHEKMMISIGMTGLRSLPYWAEGDPPVIDYFDLKGVVHGMLTGLHVKDIEYRRAEHPSFHPGKTAEIVLDGNVVGIMGELHPLVKLNYELGDLPVHLAEIDLDGLLKSSRNIFDVEAIPSYPPLLEDLAVVVEETVSAAEVEAILWKGGGDALKKVQLFDIYRGKQVGEGKKSLAFNLTYIAPDRTLTDKEVQKLRNRIIQLLDKELGAVLRS